MIPFFIVLKHFIRLLDLFLYNSLASHSTPRILDPLNPWDPPNSLKDDPYIIAVREWKRGGFLPPYFRSLQEQ